MRVLKFGGTSVGNAERMRGVAEIVGGQAPEGPLLVVVSAVGGVTDALLRGAEQAAAGGSVVPALARFHSVHREILDTLRPELGAARAAEAETDLGVLDRELENLLRGFGLLLECPPTALALLSSLGERASCALVSRLLEARGLDARLLDPKTLIRTSGSAALRLARLAGHPRRPSPPCGTIPRRSSVLPGFFGGDANGRVNLLGRGGSDYSGAIAAWALDAELLEIWTDVDGIYSADPRLVPGAAVLPEVSYEEAMELSFFGAKVLHPKTIQPAREKRIPVRVRNSFSPDHPGSLVHDGAAPAASGARGLTFLPGVSLVDVTGSGMAGVPGVAARVFQAMAAAETSVILITQGSSECAISFAVADADGPRALQALREAFAAELAAGLLDPVQIRPGYAVVSLVGDGMRDRLGVVGSFAGALADIGVNIVALAQGSTERNISAVVAAADARRAVRHIHAQLFERRLELQLILWGVGNVGSKLLRKIGEHQSRPGRRVDLKLCGVANSKRCAFDPEGLDPAAWRTCLTPPPSPPASTPCWRSSAAPAWSTPCSWTAPPTARWPPPTAACSRPACTW